MTGLSPETDVIIEIATIVTDKHLQVLAEAQAVTRCQPQRVTIDPYQEVPYFQRSPELATGFREH